MRSVLQFVLLLAVLALLVSGTPGAGTGAGAGADRRSPAQAGLVDAGWLRADDGGRNVRLAALIIRLAPGWKTYWRLPGKSGLPPRFDFSGSRNVKDVRVLWPAPKRFSDPELGDVIGYENMVVFPLLVTVADPTRPATLHLRLRYGVCDEICMPLTAITTLTLPPNARPDAASRRLVLEWVKKTPWKNNALDLQVRDARLTEEGGRLRLKLVLSGRVANEVTDILVEGMKLAVFGKPQAVGDEGTGDGAGTITFTLPVRGLAQREDFRGARLRLTILLGERAVERTISLL